MHWTMNNVVQINNLNVSYLSQMNSKTIRFSLFLSMCNFWLSDLYYCVLERTIKSLVKTLIYFSCSSEVIELLWFTRSRSFAMIYMISLYAYRPQNVFTNMSMLKIMPINLSDRFLFQGLIQLYMLRCV